MFEYIQQFLNLVNLKDYQKMEKSENLQILMKNQKIIENFQNSLLKIQKP